MSTMMVACSYIFVFIFNYIYICIYKYIYIYTFCLCISTLIRWLLINSRQMKLKFKLLDHDPWGCRGSKIAIATGVIAYYTLVNRIYKANWDQMDLSQIANIYIYIYIHVQLRTYICWKRPCSNFKIKWSDHWNFGTQRSNEFKWPMLSSCFVQPRHHSNRHTATRPGRQGPFELAAKLVAKSASWTKFRAQCTPEK